MEVPVQLGHVSSQTTKNLFLGPLNIKADNSDVLHQSPEFCCYFRNFTEKKKLIIRRLKMLQQHASHILRFTEL
jgi:hypothetical protein